MVELALWLIVGVLGLQVIVILGFAVILGTAYVIAAPYTWLQKMWKGR